MKCVFTNKTIGMTFISIGTNPTIGTNGLSELTNRIRLCILDMTAPLLKNQHLTWLCQLLVSVYSVPN